MLEQVGKYQSAPSHGYQLAALTCPGAEVNTAIKGNHVLSLSSGKYSNCIVNPAEPRILLHYTCAILIMFT